MATWSISGLGELTSLGNHQVGNLAIELGEQEELIIAAEDNLLEYFETEVRSGKLGTDTRNGVSLIAGMVTSV